MECCRGYFPQLRMLELRLKKISFPAVSPGSVSQPAATLSSSTPSVQPVTIQAQLQGVTTTSPLLAASASPPVQTIAPHVQQVPVSVLDWQLNLYIQNKFSILPVCVLWNQKQNCTSLLYLCARVCLLRCCCSPSSSRPSLCCWPLWSMTPASSRLWPLPQPWPPPPPQFRALPCK